MRVSASWVFFCVVLRVGRGVFHLSTTAIHDTLSSGSPRGNKEAVISRRRPGWRGFHVPASPAVHQYYYYILLHTRACVFVYSFSSFCDSSVCGTGGIYIYINIYIYST